MLAWGKLNCTTVLLQLNCSFLKSLRQRDFTAHFLLAVYRVASTDLLYFFPQEFATENWRTERERHGVVGKRGQDAWPFIFMMDDSCVMWQNLLKQAAKK